MRRIIRMDDVLLPARHVRRISVRILVILSAARLESINVIPGFRIGEGNVIGADTDDGAISTVEIGDLRRELAADVVVDVGDAVSGPELGTGVSTQRVKVGVVHSPTYDPADGLLL